MDENSEFIRQLEENRRAYAGLRDEIRQKYAGQFVALAFGRVIAADVDLRKVNAAVAALNPKPAHVVIFPAEEEPLFDTVLCTYTELL